MVIWGAMLIPILAVFILGFFFSKKLVWWEYIIVLVIPFLVIWGTKAGVEMSQVAATEFLGGYITHVEYHEYWKDYYHETCYESYPCGTDSKGHIEYCTRSYDCSHYRDHDPYWEAFDSNGSSWQISEKTFDEFVKMFGNKTFVNLNHAVNYDMGRSRCVDGNEYDTNIPNPYTDDQLVITSRAHTYTNRVQNSRSIFNFPKVDPKKLNLYERPQVDGWNQNVVLGDAGPTRDAGEKTIGKLNGVLGKPSKARIYALVFKNRPIQAAYDQQAYWKNGHKNEIDICVGVNDVYQPQWSMVFGWTKEETLKADIRDHVMEQKTLDLGELGTWLYPKIQGKVIRRDFREFDYVTVDPPEWAVWLVYILTILLCGGIGWFEVAQDLPEMGIY